MKKNSYYFGLLSEVEQWQYRENYNKHKIEGNPKLLKTFLNNESECFEDFIAIGFYWSVTPQGTQYWIKISDRPEPKEPTDQDQNIVLVQFIPTLQEIESVLKSDKFKKYSFKDLAYSLSAENILDIIIELQKPKP